MGEPSASSARRLRGIAVDVSPLRLDHDFRWLWFGQLASAIGTQVTRIAIPFQVYLLTGSALAIGAVAIVQIIPIFIFSLSGGAVADVIDRRRLLILSQSSLAACSLALVGLSLLPETPVLAIFVVAAIISALTCIDDPARAASIPRLVPIERLTAAITLFQLNTRTAMIVGSAVGGLLLATLGLAGAYAVDVLSFGIAIAALGLIAPLPPTGRVASAGISAIRDGLAFTRRQPMILSCLIIDFIALTFCWRTALFPVLAVEVYETGAAGLGLLYAAPALGAFLAAFLSGRLSSVRRPGRAVAMALTVWGLANIGFGLVTSSFVLVLAFLAVAGAANVVSAVFRASILQRETPDDLRGRVQSLNYLVAQAGPRAGDVEATVVASAIGAQASVVSGGIVCILGVVAVVRRFPELVAYAVDASGRRVDAPRPERGP